MSGIGRGRGWLNINKNTRPGLQDGTEKLNYEFNSTMNTSTPPKLNLKYANIISKISLYNENDDGILLNQKLKHIIEEFTKDCSTPEDVKSAFGCIHENCLIDEEFAAKAIGMASAASFNNVHIQGVKIRNLFIAQFQDDYEKCEKLRASNQTAFRNSVKMLGDFFHKARLVDGKTFKFLTSPVVKYLEMLLESNNDFDFQLFTVQLYMNGNAIKEETATDLNDILMQVRKMLATNDRLSQNSKLWLLMALDIANNRFNNLPTELHQFYLAQLGDTAMARIKKLTTELSIQTTYLNATLDSIQSNVNVLQQVSSSSDGWESPSSTNTDQEQIKDQFSSSNSSKSRNSYNKPEAGLNHIGTWQQPKNEKTPRPILGAGARTTKHDNKQESSWRNHQTSEGDWKENSNNWGDNKKKGQGSGWNNVANKQKKGTSKGWEHDDRFENEYN